MGEKLWSAIRALEERCTELEGRVSLFDDPQFELNEDFEEYFEDLDGQLEELPQCLD